MLGRKSRTGARGTKGKHNFKWWFPLFVLPQCDLCVPAWLFRTKRMASCREFRIIYSTSLENKCGTRFIWTDVDKIGEVSEAVWPLKVRFKSNVTPRSLAAATGTRSWPRKGTVMLLGNLERSCLTPKRTNWVLSGLIKRWLAQHHSATCWGSSATWRRINELMSFDANEKFILVSST